MPVDIEGWVEVKKSSKWYGHKDLNDYGVVSGEISNVLFGIAKLPIKDAILADRGLPNDLSEETKKALESYNELGNFSIDDLFGFTYALYSEILESDIIAEVRTHSQWRNIFTLMHELSMDGFDSSEIRVVLWANW